MTKLKEFKNKYFIGQKVLYINKNNEYLKSKVCNDCDGFGKIYFKNVKNDSLTCKKCNGIGYVKIIWSDPKYKNLKYDKATVGIIKEIYINNTGEIKYKITPKSFHKKLIFIDPKEILEIYDIFSGRVEDYFMVNEEDILRIYGLNTEISYPIKGSQKKIDSVSYVSEIENEVVQFNDLFNVGDNIFYVDKNVNIEVKNNCSSCKDTKILETINGEKIKCPYCLKQKRKNVDLLLHGKITEIKYGISFKQEDRNYYGEVISQKIFEISANNTLNPENKNLNYSVHINENKIIPIVKTVDEALIQLGDIQII